VYAAARNIDTLSPLVEKYGDKVIPIKIDLNEPSTITQAAAIASDVDIVINNAGILRISDPLAKDAIASMQAEVNVNVYGLIRVAQAFAPVLKQNGGGALVQINSVASIKNFVPFSTYSASKAASYSITQGLRDLLAEQGTHVVSVHPGPIATDMANEAGIAEGAEPAELVPQAMINAIENSEFHAYPDTIAKQVGEVYHNFAANIIDGG
jgi:short-subunit dehydrogenase